MQQKLLDTFIKLALKEDVGPGDHTSNACISVKDTSKARCIIKDDGILAGMVVARRAFKLVDPKSKFKALIKDGATVEYGDIAFEVTCNTRKLLLVERLVSILCKGCLVSRVWLIVLQRRWKGFQ